MKFTNFSDAEIERRRLESVAAVEELERAEFAAWYQEICDRDYWAYGQRCSGCDYWHSDMGNLGHCAAAGIVPGNQVMASLSIRFCSYTPPPGLPLTKAHFWCGKFKDEFNWASLDWEYLKKIGAVRHGALRSKPSAPATDTPDTVPR